MAGVPHFSHALIDQPGLRPAEVQGTLKTQLMQLVLLAAAHPAADWMAGVARLLGALTSLPPGGGVDYVRLFVLYLLATQEPDAVQAFRDVLRHEAPAIGEDLMTYTQELIQEGEIRAEVRIIENLLREGLAWPAIERVTGITEAQCQALKQRLAARNP